MKKRLFAVLCTMIMLMSVITPGVLADGEYKTGAELYKEGITDYKYKAGEYKKFDEQITLTFGRSIDLNANHFMKMAERGEPVTNNRWIQMFRNEVNVDAVYGLDNASGSDYNQQLLLAMTAGELPDAFITGDLGLLSQMAEAGVIMDLTEIWQENANETLGELIEMEGTSVYGAPMVDGKLYGLPIKMPSTNEYNHLWVRRDWLKEQGLDIPKTMADVKNVAKVFKANYENNVGLMFGNNYLWEMEAIFWAFDGGNNRGRDQWLMLEDGTLGFAEVQPEMKEGLKWLNDMYESGLINQEWSVESSWDGLSNYVANNRCGIFFGPHWYGFSLESYEKAGTMDETADWVPVGIPSGYEGVDIKVRANNTVDEYICINVECEHPEAVVHMLNAYVETLFGENNDFANYFAVPEMSDFWNATPIWELSPTVDLEPCLNMMAAYDAETGIMDESKLEGSGATYWQYIKDGLTSYKYMFGPVDSCFTFVAETYPDIMLWNLYQGAPTPTQVERWGSMQDLIDVTFLKMINGEIEVDGSFEKMVEEWYAMGGAEVTKEINEIYKQLSN